MKRWIFCVVALACLGVPSLGFAQAEDEEEGQKAEISDWIEEVFDDSGLIKRVGIKVIAGREVDKVVDLVEALGGTVVVNHVDGDLVLAIELLAKVNITLSYPDIMISPERIKETITKLENGGKADLAKALEDLLGKHPNGVPEQAIEEATGVVIRLDPDPKTDIKKDVEIIVDPKVLEKLEETVDAVVAPFLEVVEVITNTIFQSDGATGEPNDEGDGPPNDEGDGPPNDEGDGPPNDEGDGPPNDEGDGQPNDEGSLAPALP